MAAWPQTIAGLGPALRARQARAIDVTEQCLARIASRNPAINAFVHVCADDARRQAEAADADMAAGRYRGPLHGIPISLKDLLDLTGTPTTASSRVREGHLARRDATAVARLRHAGAVFIGKTNLHEFALGTTNEESAQGPVHHPLDLSRSPGGSSGGSAAGVLDGMSYASIGSDTGGSIRIPSAACGLVGLKPARGDVPMDGVVPLSVSLDHVGPLCRSVHDASLVYDALCDASAPPLVSRPVPGLRLARLRGYFEAKVDGEVAARFDAACGRLAGAGVQLIDAEVPHAETIGAVYQLISLPEAAAVHARTLDTCPERYTPQVRVRLEAARYLLAEDMVRARQGAAVLTAEVDALLGRCDGLIVPTMPIPATRLGAATVTVAGVEEPIRAMTLRLTQLFNITGHPALTMPCGTTGAGLPVGFQITGPAGDTRALLEIAAALEPIVSPGRAHAH